MTKLKFYKYHDKPDELLQPDIEYKFGGISLGKFNGKEIIVSSKKYEKSLNWGDAISYCKSLDIDGYKDWYLPNKDELNFMYENKNNLHEIDDFEENWYWSTESNGSYACVQVFYNGDQSSNGDKNNIFYVRAIRDL